MRRPFAASLKRRPPPSPPTTPVNVAPSRASGRRSTRTLERRYTCPSASARAHTSRRHCPGADCRDTVVGDEGLAQELDHRPGNGSPDTPNEPIFRIYDGFLIFFPFLFDMTLKIAARDRVSSSYNGCDLHRRNFARGSSPREQNSTSETFVYSF